MNILLRESEISAVSVNFEERMVQDGYVHFKNIIPLDLSRLINNNIHDALVALGARKQDSFDQQYMTVIKTMPPYEVNVAIRRYLIFSQIPQKILLIPDIFNFLLQLLGPDLAYLAECELPVNLKDVTNYHLVKKFHQEFWSGAGYRSYVLWAPFIFPAGSGGLEMIKGSHLWGHIPHRNREPVFIPEEAERKIVDFNNCSDRDILIFHSLTLHRTIPNPIDSPRLAYATHVRNIFEKDSGFETLKNWEIFHLSPTSRIMRACGNPHLSPFRTYGGSVNAQY